MTRARGTDARARLRPGHYRHPEEVPTLVASVWLALTALLVAEAAMVALVTVLPGPTRGVSLYVGIALLVWFNGGLVWGVAHVVSRLRRLSAAALPLHPRTHDDVRRAVDEAARALGLESAPPARIVPGPGLRARALGFRRPLLLLDERLLAELLDPLELKAVIARELGHLAAGHVPLRTLFDLPAPEQAPHALLTLPLALSRLCLRWWWRFAERTVDRAAAIAAGGPEPLGYALARLACAEADRPLSAEQELRRYCDDLFAGHPARLPSLVYEDRLLDAARVEELARFAHSERFGDCLARTGHLSHQPRAWTLDPERAGLVPYAVVWLLALLYLAVPVALWARAGGLQQQAEAPTAGVPFDPEAELPEASVARSEEAETQAPPGNPGGTDAGTGPLELARMHKERGEHAKARRALEDLIRTNPFHAEGHYMLAWVCIELGDRRAAEAEFVATMNLTEPGSSMHTEARQALERMNE